MTKIIRSVLVVIVLISVVILNWNCGDVVEIPGDIVQQTDQIQTDMPASYQVTFTISQNFKFYPNGGGDPSSRNFLLWTKTSSFTTTGYTTNESFTTKPATWSDDDGSYEHVNFQFYTYFSWSNAPSTQYHGEGQINNVRVHSLCTYPASGGTDWLETFSNGISPNTTYNARIGIDAYADPFC